MKKYFLVTEIVRNLNETRSLAHLAADKAQLQFDEIADCIPLRESVDARKKDRVRWIITAALSLRSGAVPKGFKEHQFSEIDWMSGQKKIKERPIVVGAGPAGLFAAYGLVKKGYKPIIVEQGKRIVDRDIDVAKICTDGTLSPTSNFVFGEGGAGTYSDGKLTARNQSAVTDEVYRVLVNCGADKEIAWQSRPHIGTDKLKLIIPTLTDMLVDAGAEILWECALTGITRSGSDRVKLTLSNGNELDSDCCMLAAGHSADAVFRLLSSAKVPLEIKTFAMGVRIEHPREFMDHCQYGNAELAADLGAASYRLSADVGDKRGVYSFCVCPGGEVMNASSANGRLAVNGMSGSLRDGKFTNGAIVVSVQPQDLPFDPIQVLEYREKIERNCYKEGLLAPAQWGVDFMHGRASRNTRSTYRPGTYAADIGKLLPSYMTESLQEGLAIFDRRIRGFIEQGIIVAPETGTSSPLRIVRDGESMESTGMKGLYPIGEGAGYAGGIISSAADGLKAALCFKTVSPGQ
ncbi:MAG: hypothetical protein JNL74_11300 [Fibrobacteres bacterium]|nr:hypothetical protein [Fibrobacterota bacterium]